MGRVGMGVGARVGDLVGHKGGEVFWAGLEMGSCNYWLCVQTDLNVNPRFRNCSSTEDIIVLQATEAMSESHEAAR